ncbi:hypothetical protein T265_09599 [Opisthorchis viverrini]|uniref:Uncharacterized protein n=1 Tax=Opisthorchis viverrini TaxID=6198 RepID=A0A074Z9M9_OPIVI|nr:hypothetical protein T265_09599 [Opisthorchis viverrini]KER22272.1 hypothetical protein T265_09599 [Opisthorchis viverrini]
MTLQFKSVPIRQTIPSEGMTKIAPMSFEGDLAEAFVIHGEKGPENMDAKKDLGIWLSLNLPFSMPHEKSSPKEFAVFQMIRLTCSRIARMEFQILYGAYVRLHNRPNQVVYSGRTKDVTLIENVQRATTRMVVGLKSVDFKTRIAVLGPLPLEYRRLQGNLILTYALSEQGLVNSFSPLTPQTRLRHDLLDFINEAEMMQEFEGTLSRFQMALQQRMALKLTPQLLADLPLPEAHTKLGQVANLIVQQNTKSGTSQGGQSSVGDQTLLIDLAGRPELTTAARKAVTQFLESTRGGGTQLQSAGPSAFTVRLRTVITREAREELIHRGHELLNQVKREMDRIYQKHDKLILGNSEGKKRFSEDYLFLTREYLRHLVKRQHALATSIWEQKEHELRSG